MRRDTIVRMKRGPEGTVSGVSEYSYMFFVQYADE